jgi:ribosomal protein S18 acetylase RimI-like enzyme
VSLSDVDYQLTLATQSQLLELKSWFTTQHQIFTWGGPNLSYPMKDDTFIELMRASHLSSYSVINSENVLVAFGQFYLRLERHHLGRLAVNPNYRNKGLAKLLITKLLEQATKFSQPREASLFVFRDNIAALKCYHSMGFREESYPDTMPANMQNCAYMVLR